jgi:hypothetical protein
VIERILAAGGLAPGGRVEVDPGKEAVHRATGLRFIPDRRPAAQN